LIVGTLTIGNINTASTILGFIKLFQVIEILGKLIFIPVHYTGLILDVLLGVYNLSDPIDISPQFLTKGKYEDSIAGYMGKITFYEEYGNILQAMPVVVGLYLLFSALNLILQVLSYHVKGQSLVKAQMMAKRLSILFLEMNLVDISFYLVLNIFVYHKFTDTKFTQVLSFTTAWLILGTLCYEYGHILLAIWNNKAMSPTAEELMDEGLDSKSLKLLPKLKYLNLIFRINMGILSVMLVHLQLYLPAMSACMIISQVLPIGGYIYARYKLKKKSKKLKIFQNWIHMASYFLIVLVIILFGLIAGFGLTKFSNVDIEVKSVSQILKTIKNLDSYTSHFIVFVVLMSVFVEILKCVSGII
jgi:hypothetical protein